MGGWKGEEGYRVEVKGEDRVAAVLPLQEHWLPLSNLDLLLPPLDVGIFFCYKNPNINFPESSSSSSSSSSFASTIVGSFKASLAKTLVSYYAFAGEVVTNSCGEPELLCSNRGVDFITAYADVELMELHLHNPDQSVEKKLIPKKKGGVLCIQLTELKCGGMVLACTFDHRIADAYSANMFLVAWAETAVGNMNDNKINKSTINGASSKKSVSAVPVPTFRRSLLSPRRLGCHDTSALDKLYVPVSSMRQEDVDNEQSRVLNRIYYISAADIKKMQLEATTGTNEGQQKSKVEAFSAYLWRAVGKAAAANKLGKKVMCRMGIVVNGRFRLKPDLLRNYFGNVLSIPFGSIGGEDLEGMCLSDVADKVHDFLQAAATEEHFLSLIDWVEARRPEPAVARIYCTGGAAAAATDDDHDHGQEEEEEEGVAFVVSSGRGFPVGELDFGWGLPVFGSYHFPWGGSAGYVMPMPSARANGDWIVYMHLRQDLLHAIETDDESRNIFHPFTPHYFINQN